MSGSKYNFHDIKNIHFVGIGGVGMSALAQLCAMKGCVVSGSDRLISSGHTDLAIWTYLEKLNIKIFPQDGSGITKDVQLMVLSSAIEKDNLEIKKANELGIKIIHRSELLASYVNKHKTIAITGTSGKSTTTSMIFEILRGAGKNPSLITGASLLSLQKEGLFGNVYESKSDLLVIEADESDGSLVNYHPHIGVLLNMEKDHKELDILETYFDKFKQNCEHFIVNADEKSLEKFKNDCKTFGLEHGDIKATNINLGGFETTFEINGVGFSLPEVGKYNLYNAVAAISVCVQLGVSLLDCAKSLTNFGGVYKRFNKIGSFGEGENRIEVIDDFAHNPHKISACLSACRLRGKRVLAYFQPHAHYSVKLLAKEFAETFETDIKDSDIMWLADIYYPGGTVDEKVSSKDILSLMKDSKNIKNIGNKQQEMADIIETAKEGDVIVVMGARDPGLTQFARNIFEGVKKKVSSQVV